MSKGKIIKTLQDMKWLGQHWRLKDFIIIEDNETIIFKYQHGDMGLIEKVRYCKNDGYTEIYDLDNYYGREVLYHNLYLPNINGEYI